MSTSIYLVSSNKITFEDALEFFAQLQVTEIDSGNASGLLLDGEACVWIKFFGSSVLDESDDDELEAWANCLGAKAHSFYELTIGKSEGSMQLAIKIAERAMARWNVVVDDLYDSVYSDKNLHEILET